MGFKGNIAELFSQTRQFWRPEERANSKFSRLRYHYPDLNLICISLVLVFTFNVQNGNFSPAHCQVNGGTSSSSITFKSAWAHYNRKSYHKSADSFEHLIKKHKPSAQLYYYAALANFSSNRRARARQLCKYIVDHFSSSNHKANCIKMFPELAKQANPPATSDTNFAIVESDRAGKSKKKKTKKKFMVATNMTRGGRPFTAESIAKDGANGIDQHVNPNCWFEASMAALAELPRGQRLLANMIRYGDSNSYIVRFPRDGVEYKITKEELKRRKINDRALWASLIECAQVMKFPNNRGANGPDGTQSRLSVGLGCITGCRAQLLDPSKSSIQQISSFIGGAVSSKNPIVCATYTEAYLTRYPPLVVGQHAFTITGFNPASKMVTIRNPHGKNSKRFHLANDPQHRKFKQMENGVFDMSLELFQKYFYQVCKSNI